MEEQKIHQWLIHKKKTLALAESCTGGAVSALFTAMPDASKYFLGSVVTYSNSLKEKILNVSEKSLKLYGAVSREVATEMWIGLMKNFEPDFGIAITGVAGPSTGSNGVTQEKSLGTPVGTVYIALGEKGKKPHVIKCNFVGDRQEIINQSVKMAVFELHSILSSLPL